MAYSIQPTKIPWVSYDCFLIAVMRGLLHVPSLRAHFYSQVPELQGFEKNPDCQSLRNKVLVPLGQTQRGHEDAAEAIRLLGRDLPTEGNPLFFRETVERTFTTHAREGAGTRRKAEVNFQVSLMLRQAQKTQTLAEVFRETRFPTRAHDREIGRERYTFTTAPNTLLLTANRFINETAQPSLFQWTTRITKIMTKLDVEPRFHMDGEFSEDNEAADYEVVYGAVHIGESIHSGHYHAVVKINGEWFLDVCLGDAMIRITEEEAMSKLRNACIICLEKNASSGEPSAQRALAIQPVGVQNDQENPLACCLTAVMQLVMNTPLRHTLEMQSHPEKNALDRFMESYQSPPQDGVAGRTCASIRKEVFGSEMQDDPQKALEHLGLPSEYTIERGRQHIPPNTIGAIVKGNKFVAIVKCDTQWYMLDHQVTKICEERAQQLLSSKNAWLVIRQEEDEKLTPEDFQEAYPNGLPSVDVRPAKPSQKTTWWSRLIAYFWRIIGCGVD